MDDEGKVTDLVEQSKLTFLREAIEEFKREQSQYDLGKEFANTRKNRSPLVTGVIIAVVAVFALGAWGITLYIQQRANQVQVSIQDFQEVNLREVLDAAKRLDNQLSDVESKKVSLQKERDDKIALMKENAQQQIQLLATQSLTDQQVKDKTAAINNALQVQISAVTKDYATKIDALNQQIKSIQDQQAQYDTRQVEQAKQQQAVLNNQQQAFELQLQQQKQSYEDKIAALTADYEKQIADLKTFHNEYVAAMQKKHDNEVAALIAKYNPTFTDPAVVGILNAPVDANALANANLADFDTLLANENVIGSAAYAKIRADLADYQTLIHRLEQVPYENSIPDALKQLEYRNLSLAREIQQIWTGLVQVVKKKDSEIASRDQTIATRNQTIADLKTQLGQFSYAMDSLVQINSENGYIIDPRDPKNVIVYLNKIRQVSNGTKALVFRNDDQFIGTIQFSVSDGTTRAAVTSVATGQHLMPFDKILIQLQ